MSTQLVTQCPDKYFGITKLNLDENADKNAHTQSSMNPDAWGDSVSLLSFQLIFVFKKKKLSGSMILLVMQKRLFFHCVCVYIQEHETSKHNYQKVSYNI
jgi:hypothetical protein